jgi:hypothetical protein
MNKEDNIWNKYCSKYDKQIYIRDKVDRIIVIGDLHGDYSLTISILRSLGIIDVNNNWIGGNTNVVQIGDQLDGLRPDTDNSEYIATNRKYGDIELFNFFTKLHYKAIVHGGCVISLLGNHELMNTEGDMTYVSENGYNKFRNFMSPLKARIEAFKRGHKYARVMACTRYPFVFIGSYMFVHAGIIDKFINRYNIDSKEKMNKIGIGIRHWLLNLVHSHKYYDIMTNQIYSPFWLRVLGMLPENLPYEDKKCNMLLHTTMKIFKLNGMIIGHTPQLFTNGSRVNATCGDRVIRVDTGMSRSFHNYKTDVQKKHPIEILEITNDSNVRVIRFTPK